MSGVEPRPQETRALLVLQRLPGVGDRGLEPLLERFGSAGAALAAPRAAFAAVAGAAAAARRADPVLVRRVDQGLLWCRAQGVEVVHRGASGYPALLSTLDNPPAVLFFRGDAALLEREWVTVVGSRKCTEYGRRVARDVATVVARHGAVVASGLALGIDGQAHRAALQAGGKTVAVLGSGLDIVYPRVHARLFRRIAQDGLLVSEFLPGERPLAHHFLQRNRTLAALARVVVVVEAARESGALNTANHAVDLGRDLLAVPGPIYASASQGANALLRQALPLVSPATVLDHLSRPAGPPSLFGAEPPESLGPEALRVWEALEGTPRHVDEVARRARLAPGSTLAALSLLEMGGWILQEAGARFARSPGPS